MFDWSVATPTCQVPLDFGTVLVHSSAELRVAGRFSQIHSTCGSNMAGTPKMGALGNGHMNQTHVVMFVFGFKQRVLLCEQHA